MGTGAVGARRISRLNAPQNHSTAQAAPPPAEALGRDVPVSYGNTRVAETEALTVPAALRAVSVYRYRCSSRAHEKVRPV